MSKIIPIFYLPKEYPEDMRILSQGIVVNKEQTLKVVLSWLESKLVTHKLHKGKPAGTPMSSTTIKNYLTGFYVLDLFKADGKLYSETTPRTRASVSANSKIEAIKPLETVWQNSSIELFEENFTRLCSQHSRIVIDYNSSRWLLQEKYEVDENCQPAQLQDLLTKHCDYRYVGHPGVGYLEIFYKEKVQIDNYLNLLNFIIKHYGDIAQKSLGLIPLANISNHLKQVSDYYTDETFKKHLLQLQLTHRIELRTTKSQLARNMGIDLVDIRGVKYGFIKILEPAIAV